MHISQNIKSVNHVSQVCMNFFRISVKLPWGGHGYFLEQLPHNDDDNV